MKVQEIACFADLAAAQGRKILSVPLKDKASAKVLFDDRGADVFVVKNGKVKPRGFGFMTTSDKWCEEISVMLDKLKKEAASGFDIDSAFIKAYIGEIVK